MTGRDDFKQAIKELLAKRVAYKCSNPKCRKPTIGPGSEYDGTVSIGVAAHITAAASGGKRFDENMHPDERKDSKNGIWLCQNCAAMIDRDEKLYTVELLESWKEEAENEAFRAVQERNFSTDNIKVERPYLDIDLAFHARFRQSFGASRQNDPTQPILITQAIWVYRITWSYHLKLINNSSVPLVNVKIYQHAGGQRFDRLDAVPPVNNIQPYSEMVLSAETSVNIECTGREAESIMRAKYPEQIQNMRYLFEYYSEDKRTFYTEMIIQEEDVHYSYPETKPEGYQ